ncbi:MAG: alpha-glucosidase [Blastopirellula sp.]|nr:MAG: alpha-glucosidase [Blastopirellula sp.]
MKYIEKTTILSIATILLLCVCMTQTAQSSDYTISSPSENHVIGFSLSKGIPTYTVSYQGTTILTDSRLSITLDGDDFSENFQIDSSSTDSKNGSWVPVVGSKSTYPDAYNERIIHLRETTGLKRQLDLIFRAYNEGVAFRYIIPEQTMLANINILSENSEFQFTDDHDVYWDDYPQAKYSKVKISAMGNNSMRPLLVEAGSHFVAIAEAGSLEHYAPMKLNRNGENRLVTRFRRDTVSATTPVSTPWRVIMVSDKPGRLVENHYLLQNLSPPCALSDTSWIKPGKVWRSKLSTAGAKSIIDYCAANNYQYVHYDAGWYGPERNANSDPVTTIDNIDIKEVIRYAEARGIGVICYINKIAMSKYDLDNTFRTYEEWGIRGVKFGFVDWEDQTDMEFLFSSIRTASQYHLVVDIHDNFRLTGIERTYPHVLTVEGILGNEERATGGNPPKNVLTTSFARMIAGAGDFTPCYLDSRVVSRSYQLALGVIFYSPLQYLHWYDQADKYSGKSFPELEFWKEMPTTWDDSKVVQGSIANYMTVARRKGDNWFVGTISRDRRSLDIPLAFLGSGTYIAKIYKEDPTDRKRVAIEVFEVTSSDTITAIMSSDSGHAIWIYPAMSR